MVEFVKDTVQPEQFTRDPDTSAEPGVVGDVLKSGGRGLAKGAIDIAGSRGDIREAIGRAVQFGAGFVTDAQSAEDAAKSTTEWLQHGTGLGHMMFGGPTSEEITQQYIEPTFGKFEEPKTRAGKYAQTIGEFLPTALIGGEAGLAVRGSELGLGALSAAAAGTASEAVGQMFEGTPVEGLARLIGGVAGGGISGVVSGRATGVTQQAAKEAKEALPQETKDVFDAYERLGLGTPTLGTKNVGGRGAQMLEANVLPQTLFGGQEVYEAHKLKFERLSEVQQDIATKFGAVAPTKELAGKDLQENIETKWSKAKSDAGKTIGRIAQSFGDQEMFEPTNFSNTVHNILGAAPVRAIGVPNTNKVRAITSVAEQTTDPLVRKAMDALIDTEGKLTFPEMQALYTAYGKKLSDKLDQTTDKAQISQLERSLRRDMEAAIRTRPKELQDEWFDAKKNYAQAMTDFRQAFRKMIGTKKLPVRPERAYDIMLSAGSTKGSADIGLFRKVWDTLDKTERGNLSANVLARMGNKDPSKLGNLEGWSMDKFLTDFRKLSPEAKDILFKQTGNADLQQAYEDLQIAVDSMQVFEKLASSSHSFNAGVMAMQAVPLVVAKTVKQLIKDALFGLAGPYIAAKLLTNPAAVRQVTTGLQDIKAGMQGTLRGAIGAAMVGVPSETMQ